MTSDLLRRNKDNPDFKLVLLTCSITYLHREAFRSDVLVCYNPPIELTIKDHYPLFSASRMENSTTNGASSTPGKLEANKTMNGSNIKEIQSPAQPPVLDGVKQLTQLMYEQIRQSTLDSPDFETLRISHTARRLYAPLGTSITLADHVHITQRFVDVFAKRSMSYALPSASSADALLTPLLPALSVPSTPIKGGTGVSMPLGTGSRVEARSTALESDYFALSRRNDRAEGQVTDEELEQLKIDLHVSVLIIC